MLRFFRPQLATAAFFATIFCFPTFASNLLPSPISSGIFPSNQFDQSSSRIYRSSRSDAKLNWLEQFPIHDTEGNYTPTQFVLSVPEWMLTGPSFFAHVLNAFGPECQIQKGDETFRMLEILTNEQRRTKFFRQDPLFESPFGIGVKRMSPGSSSGDYHQDQILCELALSGIPETTPIHLNGNILSVAQMVTYAEANLSLEQIELAWTALALAIYSRQPGQTWRNRFGDTLSFESIALELIARDLKSTCCGGLHDLHAITILYSLDLKSPYMSANARNKCRLFIERYLAQARRTMTTEGTWPADWNTVGHLRKGDLIYSANTNPTSRRQITCHMVEWLRSIPTTEFPDFDYNAIYLTKSFLTDEMRGISFETAIGQFCPNLHCWAAVDDLTSLERK